MYHAQGQSLYVMWQCTHFAVISSVFHPICNTKVFLHIFFLTMTKIFLRCIPKLGKRASSSWPMTRKNFWNGKKNFLCFSQNFQSDKKIYINTFFISIFLLPSFFLSPCLNQYLFSYIQYVDIHKYIYHIHTYIHLFVAEEE